MINRRNFLKTASFLTIGGVASSTIQATQAASLSQHKASGKELGLQIYSLGRELMANNKTAENLKNLRKAGYTYLELAGYNGATGKIGEMTLPEFNKLCKDAGLRITSTHVNPPIREYTKENLGQIKEFWKKAADDHAQIGCTYLIQPGQPTTRSIEETKFVGEVFNEVGTIAKAAGVKFGYHNHEMEFARVTAGGTEMKFGRAGWNRKPDAPKQEVVYNLMLANTDPSLVFFELDVYWAVMGQNDPVQLIKEHSDRIRVLHIKDRSVLGMSGMMNFPKIFEAAYETNIKEFFVELESMPAGKTQTEGVEACAKYLLSAPFYK